MSKAPGLGTLALILVAAPVVPVTAQSPIELDHLWIMVSPNAPERAALVRASRYRQTLTATTGKAQLQSRLSSRMRTWS